ALREYPCERELSRRAVLVLGDCLDLRDELQILVEILTLKARREAPEVVRRQVVELANLAGQKAAAERAVRDQPDSQLAAGLESSIFGLAAPQRIFILQRG